MSREQLKLDSFEDLALEIEPDRSIWASSPRVFTTEDSEYLQGVANRFPIESVVDFAATSHNIDPARLSSMALRLHSGTLRHEGSLEGEPQYDQDGLLRYPIINIAVGNGIPTWYTDYTLRHELRHVFQKDKDPLYTRPATGPIIHGIGAIASAAYIVGMMKDGTLAADPEFLGIPTWPLDNAALFASTASLIGGRRLAWAFSRVELDATVFSYRSRSFKPFANALQTRK